MKEYLETHSHLFFILIGALVTIGIPLSVYLSTHQTKLSQFADTGTSLPQLYVAKQTSLFSGRNIYAPTLLLDNGVYKMWYGGWQADSDYPNNKIYYRTSTDGITWSTPQTILTPSDIGSTVQHVNDPSVTKHFNTTNNQWQYTMFFTACQSPCQQQDNQLWSVVSSDGIHWGYPQLLLAGNGPAEPSAIVDPSGNAFWKVYFAYRTQNADQIQVALVGGDRKVISTQPVFTLSSGANISGPEVRFFNNAWHLFFNHWLSGGVNIDETVSSSNTNFPNISQTVIDNKGAYCGTLTPAILPIGGATFNMYFSLAQTTSTPCDVSHNNPMTVWQFVEQNAQRLLLSHRILLPALPQPLLQHLFLPNWLLFLPALPPPHKAL